MQTTIRTSPRFELKQLAELSPEQRAPFRELEADKDFFGLLVPRGSAAMNIKSVGHDTAALLRRLTTPSTLDADDDVIDLVLDGVLEIEADGDFLSGADALSVLCDLGDAGVEPHGIARLSLDALRHADDLESDQPDTLASALYLYNRIPISRFWRARFPDRAAVLTHLGADRDALSAWHSPPNNPGWISWTARERPPRDKASPTYKLYVSPRPENVRDAFHALARALADLGGVDFKIGEDASGLLRPDKLVAYFTSREQLDRAAAAVLARLAGCPAHGVPFTAGIDDAGLLSWGIDPPDTERVLSWMGRESWRLWLATKLADAMAFAKSCATRRDIAAWQFARERVRRFGVDVERWTPTDALWRAA
jgi:hypothetical protein